jgi:hypothetical protein
LIAKKCNGKHNNTIINKPEVGFLYSVESGG